MATTGLLAVLLGAVACSSAEDAAPRPPGVEAAAPTTAPPSSSRSTTTVPPAPPAFAPFTPAAGEPEPEAKRRAANLVQALMTYERGGGTAARAQAIAVQFGIDPGLSEAAAPLLSPEEASSGEIIYPQLGGLTADAASVMVVVRQHLVGAAGSREVSRTVGVRLTNAAGAWAVTGLEALGDSGPPATPPADPAVAAVLGNERIELPDTARWDMAAGRVDSRVVQLLAALANQWRLGVTTLATGHPVEVFGTDRMSNHTRGRAVDIWAIDGTSVEAQRADPAAVIAVAQAASAAGVTELGSPWVLELPGSFTDIVHQDHLHLGFRGA